MEECVRHRLAGRRDLTRLGHSPRLAVGRHSRDVADLILIAVSLALGAYYVIRLYMFSAAQQSKRRSHR